MFPFARVPCWVPIFDPQPCCSWWLLAIRFLSFWLLEFGGWVSIYPTESETLSGDLRNSPSVA